MSTRANAWCGQDLIHIYVSGFDDFNLPVAEAHSQRPWVTKEKRFLDGKVPGHAETR